MRKENNVYNLKKKISKLKPWQGRKVNYYLYARTNGIFAAIYYFKFYLILGVLK